MARFPAMIARREEGTVYRAPTGLWIQSESLVVAYNCRWLRIEEHDGT